MFCIYQLVKIENREPVLEIIWRHALATASSWVVTSKQSEAGPETRGLLSYNTTIELLIY